MTTKLLSHRQARWSEFLSRFNFRIIYRTGKSSAKSDALTRRSGDLSKDGDERKQHMNQIVLKSHNILRVATTNEINEEMNIDELWQKGYSQNPILTKVLTSLRNDARKSNHLTLTHCTEQNERLLYQKRIYVPDYASLKLKLIRDHHETPAAGHSGRAKTLELLARTYF